jgi:NIPSNAP
MIYELRVYQPVPGQMPKLLARFRNKLLPLWERHSIRPIGFWMTLVGESSNELSYILPWESLADRETRWTAFRNDPAWHKVRDRQRARWTHRREHQQPDPSGAPCTVGLEVGWRTFTSDPLLAWPDSSAGFLAAARSGGPDILSSDEERLLVKQLRNCPSRSSNTKDFWARGGWFRLDGDMTSMRGSLTRQRTSLNFCYLPGPRLAQLCWTRL